jgi:Spy/CpxP family protein refolding chaperone
MGMPPDHMFGIALSLSGVELSDDQVETIARSRRASAQKEDQLRTTLRSLDSSLHDELCQDKIDTDKVRKIQAEIATQRSQLTAIEDEDALKTAQVLTPEQRHKLRTALDRMSLGPMGFKHPPEPQR